MSNPKGKAIPDILSMFFIMLTVYCIDLFFWESDLTILGDNFYSRFISFAIIFMLIVFKKEHLRDFGIKKDSKRIKEGLIAGIVFSVVPILCVSLVEIVFFKFFSPLAIVMNFLPPNSSYVLNGEHLNVGLCALIYFFTALFAACFKEMFFRGFLLSKFRKLMSFGKANFFQAFLYMTFIIPKLIRNFSKGYYKGQILDMAAFVVVFFIVHEFITAVKWGMLTKVSGDTVYISIVDNFLYVFMANSIHIIDPSIKWMILIHMTLIQAMSFVLVCIYCIYNSYFTNGLFNNKDEEQELFQTKTVEKKAVSSESHHRSHNETHHSTHRNENHIEKAQNELHESRRESHHESHSEIRHEEAKHSTNPKKSVKPVYSEKAIEDKAEISTKQFKNIVSESVKSRIPKEQHIDESLSDNEIEEFFKEFSEPKGQYTPPKEKKDDSKPSADDNFDIDDFLNEFSNEK